MASRKFDPKTGKARIFFRYAGRQFNRTMTVRNDREAERACALIEETIQDLERGKLALPPDADSAAFIMSGGRVSTPPRLAADPPGEAEGPASLMRVFNTYTETLTPGSKEANSLGTEAVHRRHFFRVLGENTTFGDLGVDTIQGYVDARAREGVGRETIRKELSTLRVVWGWASKRRHVDGPATWKMQDLTFPKAVERPPFQTWDQIARKIGRGGLTAPQQAELWECLWLDQGQTVECLEWVREHAGRPSMFPMFAFAAYTGARRGEMLRSERDDWDFGGGIVTIRQKKADKSKSFTRRNVPIHPDLAEVMRGWFADHPGGPWTICMPDGRPFIPQTASEYLRATLRGGKWSVLHGWHTFRHSLASNMASAGTDQRIISEILGHHTEEMERRYRHLLPRKQEHALHALFATGKGQG